MDEENIIEVESIEENEGKRIDVYKNFDDASNLLVQEKKLYKKMHELEDKGAHCVLNKKTLIRVKDYKHYYGNGWVDGNPLEVDKSEKWKDRLVKPFIKIKQVIYDLADTNNLNMLNPIIKALNEIGIYISYDIKAQIKFSDEVNGIIGEMDEYQDTICDLADEKREIMNETHNYGVCSKRAFNSTCAQLAKSKINSSKVPNSIISLKNQENDNLTDNSLFNNIIDNVLCNY